MSYVQIPSFYLIALIYLQLLHFIMRPFHIIIISYKQVSLGNFLSDVKIWESLTIC